MKGKKLGPTKSAILEVLVSLQLKHGKSYCFPTQRKILELLKIYHGIDIHRRALNYHLADLVEAGLISRTRRIRKDRNGGLIFKSTLYFIKNLGYKVLDKIKLFGSKVEKWLISNSCNRSQRRAAAHGVLKFLPDGMSP